MKNHIFHTIPSKNEIVFSACFQTDRGKPFTCAAFRALVRKFIHTSPQYTIQVMASQAVKLTLELANGDSHKVKNSTTEQRLYMHF
ncbi:hypothetical protein HGP28_18610 [Vibrio sp. SM6]|uniref:Uncharacterized protein n=1 Tax=Vibrio agarilyticus TaxID=2726741 RepID=A0A7X8YI72_9VIBR|nr:hypothetical protein [Vibrio agarilyticus]NLS14873.1 hypothetical protein [Vibrio agarilyticus]